MADLELEVSRREESGKGVARKLRQKGRVPAVVYGGHKEPVSISVDQKSVFELVRKSEHGIRSIFLLKMADSDQSRHAMIKDIQMNPISRKMNHIDFVRVVMDEVVRVTIPVRVSGTSIAVRNGEGVLDFQARELHVECLPGSIPDEFVVDVSSLKLHDVIRVSDLEIPEGVEMLEEPDRLVVSIATLRAEVVEEVTEEAEVEPELIKKGKDEEEDE